MDHSGHHRLFENIVLINSMSIEITANVRHMGETIGPEKINILMRLTANQRAFNCQMIAIEHFAPFKKQFSHDVWEIITEFGRMVCR